MVGVLAGVLTITTSITQAQVSSVFNMPTGETSLQFVPVGNPGNAADPLTGYGSVGYTYQMGKYDVTLGQYTTFLNAVAQTDTYGLYYSGMATDYPTVAITQSGSPGSYRYSVTGSYSQAANCPVFDVSWGDAARFCNWLQNNQPTGAEGSGTTETGAYTLNGATTTSALSAITRNAGAVDVIPSENEWHKAAYYNPSNASYWLYPTQSNTAPSNVLSATGTNNANFSDENSSLPWPFCNTDPTNELTPVGAFAASPGPYGTYDMGGDVCQWNEHGKSSRGLRGGFWDGGSDFMPSTQRNNFNGDPTEEDYIIGFRVAEVPEPSGITLLMCGGLCLIAYAWRRRRQTA